MRTREEKIFQLIGNIIMWLAALMAIIPLILLLSSSLTENNALIKYGYRFFPTVFSTEAYSYIFSTGNSVLRAYFVSFLLTAAGTVISLIITTMLAYPLAKQGMPFRGVLTFIVFFTMLFNGGLVPTYMNYTTIIGIKNTYLALLLPNLMFSAVNCIIVRTYFQGNIPAELYESARIDGASEFKIFTTMVLPLGKPILVTIGIFAGLGYWNDWMNGLYYITDQKMYSIQQLLNVMIQNIQYLTQYGQSGGQNIPSIGLRMAIAFVAMLPLIVLYPFLQKYFEAGITLGAVKG